MKPSLELPTRIPDVRGQSLWDTADRTPCAEILKRIMRNRELEVAVAAFQSSI